MEGVPTDGADGVASSHNVASPPGPKSPVPPTEPFAAREGSDGPQKNTTSFAKSTARKVSFTRQGPPPSLVRSFTSSANTVTSFTPLTSSSSTILSTDEESSSHGPLPEWAYFYDPALSYAQVKYIESQMKSQEEYSKIPASQRQRVVVNDLQQALSSMRQVYSRSTEVVVSRVHNSPGASSPEVTARHPKAQPAHQSVQVLNANDAVLAVHPDGDESVDDHGLMDRNRRTSEAKRDDQSTMADRRKPSAHPAPSNQPNFNSTSNIKQGKIEKHAKAAANDSPTAKTAMELSIDESALRSSPRRSRGEPVYNLARVSGTYTRGKRTPNEDEVQPKRQRLPDQRTLAVNEKGRARVVWSPFHVSRPADSEHASEPPMQTSTAVEPNSSARFGSHEGPRSYSTALLLSSTSPETSDEGDPEDKGEAEDGASSHKRSSSAPQSPYVGSLQQADVLVDGTNVGAAKKRGVVTWFDEEIQLLIDLRALDKSWDEICEAIPRHTRAAIRAKYSNIRQDERWTPKRQDNLSSKPVYDTLHRSVKSDVIEKKAHISSPNVQVEESPDRADDRTRKQRWTVEELEYLRKAQRQGRHWQEISEALPRHPADGVRQKYLALNWERSMAEGSSQGGTECGSRTPGAKSKAKTQLGRLRQNGTGKRKTPRPSEALTADSSGRLYHVVIDKFGRRLTDSQLLLPGNYNSTMSDLPGLTWVCPIRSCRLAFHRPTSLDTHWARVHRKCLLNDNNDGTFSIKGEYRPKKIGMANALVISRNPLDPNESPMVETRGYRQVQLETMKKQLPRDKPQSQMEKPGKQPKVNNKHNGGSDESGVIGQVIVPADLTMATNIRGYREWPDHTGALVHTFGTPLPVNYRLAEYSGFEWLCPIRTCGRIVSSLRSLGGHFSSGHAGGILLNDNRDGTFTEVGQYNISEDGSKRRPAVVKSKNPSPPNAPPRAPPKASPFNLQGQIDLAASIAEWEKRKLANPLAAKPTVDEFLAGQTSSTTQAGRGDNVSTELSDALTLSDSDLTEGDAASAKDTDLAETSEPVEIESDGEASAACDLMNPIARENWATIQNLFTDKTFPPPQSGPLKELISLRRAREVELHPTAALKFHVQWPKDVSLLIVQLVGRESPMPCNRCAKGSGVFSSCVVVSQDVANVLQAGFCACVNCSWKSAYHKLCDVSKLLEDVGESTVPRGASPRSPVIDAPGQSARADSFNDGGSESDQPQGARRSRRPLMSDGSDNDQPNRTRHSKRLTRNAMKDNDRGEQVLKNTVSPAEDVRPSDVSALRKMTQTTKVDESFSFRVDVVSPGTTLLLQRDVGNLRICSLATGRVKVKVQGEQVFDIGFQGMFRLLPGAEAEVRNSTGFDAVLQISSFKGR